MKASTTFLRGLFLAFVAASFTPLSVLAQSSSTSSIARASETVAPATISSTATPSSKTDDEPSATSTASSSPTPTQYTGVDYFPPGQSYGNVPDETPEQGSVEGAEGSSDTFINVPMSAQIGIICAVVVVGVLGFIAAFMFFLRRRRQWEMELQRRSVMNARVEAMQRARAAEAAKRSGTPASSAASVAESNVDLEKQQPEVKSEFESEKQKGWRSLFPK